MAVAGEPSAGKLFRQGRKHEKKGEVIRAYLLYAQAAAADPSEPKYWMRAEALRTKASMLALPMPAALAGQAGAQSTPAPQAESEAQPPKEKKPIPTPTPRELAEAREPQPPIRLSPPPGRKDVDLRGNSKELFEQVARLFGMEVVFDGDYQPTPPIRFRLGTVGYREALHALMTATSSFIVPISETLFMVVKDTPQKRIEVENTVSLTIPIPEPVTLQEAQELARTVQQVMEIRRFAIDSSQRLVFMRDAISKVVPAKQLFEQLLHKRAQILIEVEYISIGKTSALGFGLSLPTAFPIVNFSGIGNSDPFIPEGFLNFFTFGGGNTFLGIGITGAELFATLTKASANLLLKADVRTVDGLPATFLAGDKYPIQTGGYINVEPGDVFGLAPSFNFEDLGLSLKITPKVHGTEEVTLEVEAEFKTLAGSSLNGIPIIANRQFINNVRLGFDQSAVIAGLVNLSRSKTFSGLPGVPVVGPLLGRTTTETQESETLLILTPHLLNLPPTEMVTSEIWTGTETRPRIPL
ncbi:MAG: type II secretion system protein GspD [Bryobacteraceae bacterium]